MQEIKNKMIDEKLLKKTEEIHYDLLSGMYFTGEKDFGDTKVMWHNELQDEEWNYGTRIQTKNPESTISKVSKFLINNNRKPGFYLTPFYKTGDLEKKLQKLGFETEIKDSWMFLEKTILKKDLPKWVRIKKINKEKEMIDFVEVYSEGFGIEEKSYEEAIIKSWERKPRDVNVNNYIVYDKNNPISIISLINKEKFYGIYNLATKSNMRKKGIGTGILYHAVKEIQQNPQNVIFLMTEENSNPERFYEKLGFETKFKAKGYIKK